MKDKKRIHLIACGGAAMHNLCIGISLNGHIVTGSDDEIYNPAHDRLKKYGLLPKKMGWDPAKITKKLDFVILGMHARKDNPELLKAQELGLKIYSYPEYIAKHAKKKKRVVISGSHGKTTTTSMIMHVLSKEKIDFDYMVGALVDGFDVMARFSDAPIMIIEGDEYLSSPIDRRPKFLHYRPHIAVMTGIAWDHINVFPTFKNYKKQFQLFIESMPKSGLLYYFNKDKHIEQLVKKVKLKNSIPYEAFDHEIKSNETTVITPSSKKVNLKIIGQHNLENMKAAFLVCQELGIAEKNFFKHIKTFKGADRRLATLVKTKSSIAFLDFAHAPSKVEATVRAVKSQYPKRKLIACVELHTFSSLNKKFHKEYKHTMASADRAFVFFSRHTLKMKKLPSFSEAELANAFDHPNLTVCTDNQQLLKMLNRFKWHNKNLLLMSSGNFGGLNLKKEANLMLK